MESEDDYQSLSPPEEPSPAAQRPRFKRLKKASKVANDPPAESVEEELLMPPVDSFQLKALKFSETLGSEDWGEPLRSQSPSESFGIGNELNFGTNGFLSGENGKGTKRSLGFDDMNREFDGKKYEQSKEVEENIADLKMETSEKKRLNEEDSNDSKEKKKKRVKSVGDDAKPKTSSPSRRREEKERRNYLQQLHAESQRLLRETRDATFKPIPVVQKPISSVLEKIRQRKVELLKKSVSLSSNCSSAENNASLRELRMDHNSVSGSIEEREVNRYAEVMEEERKFQLGVESSLDPPRGDGSKEAATQHSHENDPSKRGLEEQLTHEFRAPVDDTQDLFCDSQTTEEKDEMSSVQNDSHLEEVLAPSLLAMNLKFDSATPDDISSDEDDNDKENIDPEPDRADNGCSSPKGDPVKAFVDEEAVEEDNSDNDLMRFPENEEDEGTDDYEEFNDLIATEYVEKEVDNERRNELHQKWLEQQDAAGTDNLLQRLKCGSKLGETTLLEEEEEDEEEEGEEFDDSGGVDQVKTSLIRINSRKARQMIPQLFSEKNDGYLSPDDEETEKKLVKQRILVKVEEKGTLLSPVEDDCSREVFGMIKKLNIVPDAKKKAKTSFFDKMLTGGGNSGSSKSSFLGRASSHSLPSSHKQGTSKVRSFIFGRDDSNSRSSISMSDDSSDVSQQENRPVRIATSKFSCSQTKFSTQSTKNAAETATSGSLFEILKRSSMPSNTCNQDNVVGLTQTLFASFKIPKKPVKIEGRT